jgi:hypothetical protein
VDGPPSDLVLIEHAIDSAHVLDDYLRGVVGLAGGQAGGDEHDGGQSKPQAWVRRVLIRAHQPYGQRHVIQGMAAMFAPEQMRKAAIEAVQLSSHIDALATASSSTALRAATDCVELGVAEFATTLSDRNLTSTSAELRGLHRRLGRVIRVLNEARTRATLEAMRSSPPPDP